MDARYILYMVVKMKSKDTTVGTIFKSRKSKTFNIWKTKSKSREHKKKKKKQKNNNIATESKHYLVKMVALTFDLKINRVLYLIIIKTPTKFCRYPALHSSNLQKTLCYGDFPNIEHFSSR